MSFIMGFIYFIIGMFGLLVFLYAFIESTIYLSLCEDRGVMCPEKFIKKEKATDTVAIVHNLYFAIFGVSCAIFGLSGYADFDKQIVIHAVTISCGLSLVDMLLSWHLEKKHDLKNTMLEIMKQWKTEKKISDIHNHEVNMYRDIKAFEKYKKQTAFSTLVNLIVVILATFV